MEYKLLHSSFIVISTFLKPQPPRNMDMDNFHINKYTFLFLKCTYSSRHKLALQVYFFPFLHGINLLKFIPRQFSILRPHGLYHSACLLVHFLTHTASSTTSTTTSRHEPSVYPSPSQHIVHPHGNLPLRMPYVVTTNVSNISDFVVQLVTEDY